MPSKEKAQKEKKLLDKTYPILIAFIAFKTIYKQFIPAKDLHSAPKKNFGNSFGNRTVISPAMQENAELVNVFGNNGTQYCMFLDGQID